LRGDPHRLRQVLLNLVSNAIKFTECGEVSVWVECLEAASAKEAQAFQPDLSLNGTRNPQQAPRVHLRFSIRDTGIGLSDEAQQNLFQPFTQADSSTTRKFGGTGLGLAICRRLVELMGGEIGVTSKLGAGATFWFTVRLEQGQTRDEAAAPAAAPLPARNELICRQPLRVLLVEDNRVNEKLATAQLRKLGCQVETARNGLEALSAWRRGGHDLIFMDCHMPEMDGFEATRAIRGQEQEQALAHIRIVAMTANAMQGDRENCFRAGMDDYIAKPVDTDELKALLKRNFPDRFEWSAGVAEDERAYGT
jgi:CheY-like chemotaxis protein